MMSEKDELERQRELFQAWYSKNYSKAISHMERHEKSGDYICRQTRAAWRAWQASRSSIEIELPECTDAEDKEDMLEMCRQSIHYASLKIKGEL